MARARRKRWMLAVNALCLVLAIVGAFFTFFARREGTGDALAAPAGGGGARRLTIGDASTVVDPADAGSDAAPEPIDLAIAPDGGVPFHPKGTRYRSPFANPTGAPPAVVKVGMLLNTIDDYDVKTGTFTADFFVSFTSTTPIPPLDLQFPNGKVENKEVIADKATFKLFRLSGAFKSPADLRKYPFDAQELRIIIEDDVRGIDQLKFVADPERQQLARGFRAVGWQVSFVEAKVNAQSYPDRFEGDDLFYGRYTFTIGVERFATSAAFKVFVPAFVIVLISLLGMWVPPDEMEVRSNSGAPMLAGAVLFHFALMQELPATSYLTRADKLMLGVYIALALGMLSTWWMFLVKEDNMHKVFRIARIIVPIASAITMVLACFF